MLSDEEREAIDYLQLCYDLSTVTNEILSKLGIVLNLIEKQSKEIEELKEKNEFLNWYFENQKENFIHKDKIKAKIEYLLKRYDSEEDFCSYDVLISILKSLL